MLAKLAAVMKVLNPSPIHYENNIPRGSAPRYVDSSAAVVPGTFFRDKIL
jgi:hypothetical protein